MLGGEFTQKSETCARFKQLAEPEAMAEGYEIDAVFWFTGRFIANVAWLRAEVFIEQKQRLQKVPPPKGVMFAKAEFETAETSPL